MLKAIIFPGTTCPKNFPLLSSAKHDKVEKCNLSNSGVKIGAEIAYLHLRWEQAFELSKNAVVYFSCVIKSRHLRDGGKILPVSSIHFGRAFVGGLSFKTPGNHCF